MHFSINDDGYETANSEKYESTERSREANNCHQRFQDKRFSRSGILGSLGEIAASRGVSRSALISEIGS